MRKSRDDLKKAEELLRTCVRQGTEERSTVEWREAVMSEVRRIGPLPRATTESAERFVWRFAAATSALALLLGLCSITVRIDPGHRLAMLLLDDPVGFMTVVTQSP